MCVCVHLCVQVLHICGCMCVCRCACFTSMCLRVSLGVCKSAHACEGLRLVSGSSSISLPSFTEEGFLLKPRVHHIATLAIQLARGILALLPQAGITVRPQPTPCICMGSGDSNSSPNASLVSALTTEPSLQTHF